MLDMGKEKRFFRDLLAHYAGIFPQEYTRSLDERLCRRLMDAILVREGDFLFAFAPVRGEPDIGPFLSAWLETGGLLAMPVWLGGSEMVCSQVYDIRRDLQPGPGGIMTPKKGLRDVAPGEIGAAVVPGMAFSERKQRLGRGAGCYDTFLRKNEGILKIGAAYDYQIFPVLPTDVHDVAMDKVATPGRLIE